MIEQKRNTVRSIATALAMGVMLFLLSSFSNKPFKLNNTPSQYILKAEFHADGKAAIVDPVQVPAIKKGSLPLLSGFSGDNNYAYAYDRKILSSFILIQKTQLTIKPQSLCRFYYHLFPNTAEDLPEIS
jgi:hypothetical protein